MTAALWTAWDRGYRSPAPGPASPAAVTFPDTDLVFRVQIAPGADLSADPGTWPWADVTEFVRYTPGIVFTAGRRDETSRVTTASCRLTFDNIDGRFTRRYPTGPYFGLLTLNTPIWIQVDPGDGYYTVLEAYVVEWPTSWPDKSEADCIVPVVCAGILRRLSQGSRRLSAVRRTTLAEIAAGTGPDYYAPLEDSTRTTADIYTAVGQTPSVRFPLLYFPGSLSSAPASLPYADFDLTPVSGESTPGRSRIGAPVSATGAGTYLKVAFLFRGTMAGTPLPTMAVFSITRASGTSISINMYAGWTSDAFGSTGVAATGLGLVLDTFAYSTTLNPFDGKDHWIELLVTQNGGNIEGELWYDGFQAVTDSAAGTLSTPTEWIFRPGAGSLDALTVDNTGAHAGIGHPMIYASDVAPNQSNCGIGFDGEQAHVRLARVCAEENVRFETNATVTVAMGPQTVGTLVDVLRQGEAAGQGVLYEKRFGLAYQSLDERLNAPSGLTVDMAAGEVAQPPAPTDDDQRLRNLWTVSRTSGSEATVEQETGSLGTGSGGPGTYDDSATVNVFADGQLPDQAGWRTWLGVVDEDRWPRIDINFARSPDLIPAWMALGYGARITLANPPSPPMPPADVDAVIEGCETHLNPREWRVGLNTSPHTPYRVGVLANTSGDTSELLGWLDWDSCTLNTAVDETETTWLVDADPVDTTDSDDYPRDVVIGGEVVTVTACSGASAPQTWTVTRSVNDVVKSHAAGAVIELRYPIILSL